MIIRNGTVVTATQTRAADLRIEGEHIKEIGTRREDY
jgi:dihydroorotase-like cyclic amidohydrolase